jgi:hypothetical protein
VVTIMETTSASEKMLKMEWMSIKEMPFFCFFFFLAFCILALIQ